MSWKRPSLALAVSVVLGMTVASCGGAKPKPPAIGLAHDITRLDRLVVQRSDAFPQNHIRFSFPASVTVSDAAQVQRVARALLALPVMRWGSPSPARQPSQAVCRPVE
jgi:hypothetical protein